MPKGPILAREAIYSVVRGQQGGTLRHYEFNKVDTELGSMAESRSMTDQILGGDGSKVIQMDLTDMTITKITVMDDNDFQNIYGTGGAGMIDWNS